MLFLKILVMLLLLGYIAFAFFKEKDWTNTQPCKGLVISIQDSTLANFVTESDVLAILEKRHLNPVGQPMAHINSKNIEKALASHQFILESQCYKTADDFYHIDVSQRLPVMRIMNKDGENYFIDGKGDRIPHVNYPADVVIATGCVSQKYAKRYLAPIGRALRTDAFWNAQIEQLNVLDNGSVEMMPRVGNHVVFLGSPVGFEKKFKRLKTFYSKVLNNVGWNKYNRISLEFANQIICTKSE